MRHVAQPAHAAHLLRVEDHVPLVHRHAVLGGLTHEGLDVLALTDRVDAAVVHQHLEAVRAVEAADVDGVGGLDHEIDAVGGFVDPHGASPAPGARARSGG